MKIVRCVILITLFARAAFSGEQLAKEFIIKNQSVICEYNSIEITEKIVAGPDSIFKVRNGFDLVKNKSNLSELMSGIAKYPIFDNASWVFAYDESITEKRVAIESNNPKIDAALQEIQIYTDNNYSSIKYLEGKIYTKVAALIKDSEYYTYLAKYKNINGAFLPDTIDYYKHNDSLRASPIIKVVVAYKFSVKNKTSTRMCWETAVNCEKYPRLTELGLLKKFFQSKSFEEKICYLGGEMLEHQKNIPHIGANLQPNLKFKYKKNEDYGTSTIWGVSITDSTNSGVDYYTEIEKQDNRFKMSKIRAFALPGLYYMILDSLSGKKQRTSEEDKILFDIKLWTSTDDSLKRYFLSNESEFDKLYDSIAFDRSWKILNLSRDSTSDIAIKSKPHIKRLHINVIQRVSDSILKVNLGGWLDNEVGYLRVDDKHLLPKIFKTEYILIEWIKGKWYLYKST